MEFLPGVHRVPGVSWSRSYLIEDDTLALVDAGLPWHARRVVDYIRSIGRRPEELSLILITHAHPDHTSGALGVRRSTGAEIVGHVGDTKTHRDREVSHSYMGVFTSLKLPLPFPRRLYRGRGLSGTEYRRAYWACSSKIRANSRTAAYA